MDNDNKVIKMTEKRHQEVLMFLQDELTPLKKRNSADTYNLEKEYAKTKKNKSPFVVLVLLGCIAVVALVAFGLGKSIEKTNKEIKVNLEEFDDVNLKNLIDTVARTQDRYEAAVRNRIQLEAEKGAEVTAAVNKRDNELLLIRSLNLSNKKDEADRQKQANETYEEEMKAIDAKYEVPLSMAFAEVEEYKKKLEEYDQSKLAVAQEQDKALDSQRQLQEIEKRKLIEKYDSRIANLEKVLLDTQNSNNERLKSSLETVRTKYQAEIDALDPVIKDKKADGIVQRSKENDSLFTEHKMYTSLEEGNPFTEVLEKVKSVYDDFKYLDKKVIDTPHKNSVGEYVRATDKMVDDISISFADATYSLFEKNIELEKQIDNLEQKIVSLGEDYKKQVADLNAKHNAEIASTKEENDVFLVSALTATNTAAIIKSADSKDNIVVFVIPSSRNHITAEGVNVEIKGKKSVKGRIVPMDKGDYLFVPNKDKNGNEISFDLSDVTLGAVVKLGGK